MRMVKEVKKFATENDAFAWLMKELEDEDFHDNFRFSYMDDEDGRVQYQAACDDGCCGSYDTTVEVGGRLASIGCNYGH